MPLLVSVEPACARPPGGRLWRSSATRPGRCRPRRRRSRARWSRWRSGHARAGEGTVVRRGEAGSVRRVGGAGAASEVVLSECGDRAVHRGGVRGGVAGDTADAAERICGRSRARSSATRSRRPVPLARERAKAAYSPAEIDGFLRLADAQSTRARRMRASALVCLGAGAGMIAGELRRVRGSDIVCRAGGVLVLVSAAGRGRCRSSAATTSGCSRRPRSPASGT